MTVHDATCRWTRIGRLRLMRAAACALALALATPGIARAQIVPGEVHVETSQGFARILVQLSEEVESDVRHAGAIVVVHFRRPVDVGIEKLSHVLPAYIGAVRRDPDGKGFRIALNRRASVHSMAAGERLYIDLLPDTWKGLAPGLPKEVIEELSRRAREAERHARAQRQIALRNEKPARVRVATQPTFTRYVFELPDIVPVTADRGDDDVTLTFATRLKFDFGELKAMLPKTVKSIESFEQRDSVSVRFALNGKADVRTFREDKNYVLDVSSADAKEAVAPAERPDDLAQLLHQVPSTGVLSGVEPPQTVPTARPQPARAQAHAPVAAAPATPAASPTPQVQAAPASQQATAAPVAVPAASPWAPAQPTPDPTSNRKPMATVAPALGAAEREGQGRIQAQLARRGDSVRLTFPFPVPTSAAIFRRAGTLWMVFDSRSEITLPDTADSGGMIRHAQATALPDGHVVRLMLDRPRLVGAVSEGGTWTVTIGDDIADATAPLSIDRSLSNAVRPSIAIPLQKARELHRIADPDMGDSLLVVTAPGPARGFIKAQDFVEFRALASVHGVAVQPLADDVQVELSPDNVIVARPSGLTLSGPGAVARSVSAFRPMVFDPQLWGFDRQSNLTERLQSLIAAAADAGETRRNASRLELARFYIAREMYPEARGVLDVALAEERASAEDPSALVLRAITALMLNRPDEALKDLRHPMVGDQLDAPLWRAFAQARLGRYEEARIGFKRAQAAIAMLPVELQRITLKEAIRAAIEVRDYDGAQKLFVELQTIGVPPEMMPALSVLQGRLAQGIGKVPEALRNFQQAAESDERPSAAEGRLRGLLLRYEIGDLGRADLIAELETLSTVWRGDDTEIEALHHLVRLYTEEQRFREAFFVMRSALKAHPNAQLSRRIHDEAAATFDSLFLAGKGDALPAIEALSLFYDFRELTPIGRRGDEIIRRLADRLVSVDLLPQAAELLQYQIDNRLQGAARAHVATRLAVVYLMDHKPDRAQAVLRATRMADLNSDLRQLRLLLEARSLSDGGRHDLALEVIESLDGREALRLRADILWAAKRFREAAEKIEQMYGDRWQDFAPLTDAERADVLRAAIGYSLGGDTIGIGRLKERYGAKMVEGPDKRAFEIATAPHAARGEEFRDLAKTVTAFGSLEAFLREMRGRYPEIGTLSHGETQRKVQQRHTQLPERSRATASAELQR